MHADECSINDWIWWRQYAHSGTQSYYWKHTSIMSVYVYKQGFHIVPIYVYIVFKSNLKSGCNAVAYPRVMSEQTLHTTE